MMRCPKCGSGRILLRLSPSSTRGSCPGCGATWRQQGSRQYAVREGAGEVAWRRRGSGDSRDALA